MTDNQENFKLIKNFIEKDFIEFIQDYFSIKINSNQYDKNFKYFTNGYEFYGDSLVETILQNSCESLSELIGVKLLPSHSITNMFMKGDDYKQYVNNFSEISAILFLGSSNPKNNFSIQFNNESELNLNIGDLVIFENKKISPKKIKISDNWVLQCTLNFVDHEGNFKDYIYDNRKYLGFPIIEQTC